MLPVKVTLLPEQNVVTPPAEMVGVTGVVFTVTVTLPVLVQPELSIVTV